MNKVGKNLLDVEKEIQVVINDINKNDEHIIGVELNKNTLDYLKANGIYGFGRNGEIPIIINNFMLDNEIKFHREKNSKATEYEPYEPNIETFKKWNEETNINIYYEKELKGSDIK